jgi:quercetin dioxygenase-like cupin family protein
MKLKTFLTNPTPENARAIPGALFHFLARGEQSANSFALIQIEVYKGNEPPAHIHTHEDESYFIIEGDIRFWIGDKIIEATAGDFIFLPKGVPHKFELLSDKVKELMWISPAGLDQWFWDNSAPSPDQKALPIPQGPPPPELVSHFVNSLSTYGVEMVS